MDLKFVSCLLSVVELGSLAAAARAEGITASAVAQRVAALEAELKAPLLRRAGRVMQPTPQCRAVLPQLRRMVAMQGAVTAALHLRELAGPLRLGAVSTALGDYAPHLAAALRQHAPEVGLHLVPGASSILFSAFEEERLDAAILVRPPFELPKTMQFRVLARQPVCLMRPEHAVPEAALPYIVYSRGSWGGAACWQALSALAPKLEILAEADAPEMIAQMVQDGLGQAVLPDWAGRQARFPGLEVSALPAPPRDIGMLTWTRDAERPVIEFLVRQLTGRGKALGGAGSIRAMRPS